MYMRTKSLKDNLFNNRFFKKNCEKKTAGKPYCYRIYAVYVFMHPNF